MTDLYGAVSDAGVNHVIAVVRAQAPYLFNYVSPTVKPIYDDAGNFLGMQERWLACVDVPPPPPGVPRYRRIPPFKLPGVPVELPCAVHVTGLKVDFHPGNEIALPPELGDALSEQWFAMELTLRAGLPCIPPAAVRFPGALMGMIAFRGGVLPVDEFHQFEIRAMVTGRLRVDAEGGGAVPVNRIRLDLGGVEIVDLAPSGLEDVVECYLVAVLKGGVLPGLVLGLEAIPVGLLGIEAVKPSLTKGLPHNPAVEEDQLRVWLDLAFKA